MPSFTFYAIIVWTLLNDSIFNRLLETRQKALKWVSELHNKLSMTLVVIDALDGEDHTFIAAELTQLARYPHHFEKIWHLVCILRRLLVSFGLSVSGDADLDNVSEHGISGTTNLFANHLQHILKLLFFQLLVAEDIENVGGECIEFKPFDYKGAKCFIKETYFAFGADQAGRAACVDELTK